MSLFWFLRKCTDKFLVLLKKNVLKFGIWNLEFGFAILEVNRNGLFLVHIRHLKSFSKHQAFFKLVAIPSREIISSKCSTLPFTEFIHLTETKKNLTVEKNN